MIRFNLALFLLSGFLILGIDYQDVFGQTPDIEVEMSELQNEATKPIPDWLKNNFRWYLDGQITQKELLTSINWLLDNNYMHLSEKAAIEVQELRDQVNYLKERLIETNPSINLDARKSGNESSAIGTLRSLAIISETQPIANNLVSNTINNGTTNFDEWSEVILQIRNELSKTLSLKISDDATTVNSVAEDLQKIVVLCNNAFDKESGIIKAELALISGVPKIATTSQEDSSLDKEIREIERNYWLGKVGKIVNKIESLQTGITALEDHIGLIENKLDSEKLTDLNLQEDIQKQKQKLEKISNEMTTSHEVAKSIISNIRA